MSVQTCNSSSETLLTLKKTVIQLTWFLSELRLFKLEGNYLNGILFLFCEDFYQKSNLKRNYKGVWLETGICQLRDHVSTHKSLLSYSIYVLVTEVRRLCWSLNRFTLLLHESFLLASCLVGLFSFLASLNILSHTPETIFLLKAVGSTSGAKAAKF